MTPAEIRALRGDRSRAEFAALIGVTPLTVYRWELPENSPELRRPRGKVLARLQAWIASNSNASPSASNPPAVAPAAPVDPDEFSLLSPILESIDNCALEESETALVGLLSSDRLRSDGARALVAISLAKLQLLIRHDARSAFATLLALGPDVSRLPTSVQLQFHIVSAFLYGHPDRHLFNPGRSNHHAVLAESLLRAEDGDLRFLLGFAQFATAGATYDWALIARVAERFAEVRDLATTPLNRALALEADVLGAFSFVHLGETKRKLEAFSSHPCISSLPMQHARTLIWRSEVLAEEAAPPEQPLACIDEAKGILRRHRIATGVHAMLMTRNEGEALLRAGRLTEAEAALREAARYGEELSYMPVRIYTAQARLCLYTNRVDTLRVLADAAAGANDFQRDLTRAFGKALHLLAEIQAGQSRSGNIDALVAHLGDLRRLGAWAVAWRHLVLHALAVIATYGTLAQAERALQLATRALEWSPSPTASAIFRAYEGVILIRRGRFTEARQSLEAASATFGISGNVPEAALVRRSLAQLDVLTGAPEGEARLAQADAELARLGMVPPPTIGIDAPRREAVPLEVKDSLPVGALVVPLQRLAMRGVGAPILQKELVNIVAELFPDRSVQLEEVGSTGLPIELASRPGGGEVSFDGFEFSDGVERRLRLGISGELDASQRAAVGILVSAAALAFEVAALRGLSVTVRERAPSSPAAAAVTQDTVGLPEFVAASPAMRKLKTELKRLSGSRATIIVTGESGTGKEVVARAIHDLSNRAGRPYVTFNSAAVPRELFEGQLFGYRKGAFTGATNDHPGVIRAAEGGTLFLDEIGELPLEVQPKLLRFLENGEVFPLGVQKPVHVDVRVIAATHRDLLQLVREGKFREDLYYRLQVIPVYLPALRERREDVVALARHFLRKLTPEGRQPPTLTPDAERKLASHGWPGNVRELRNVVERMLAFDPVPASLGAEHIRI